jgi:hypothetical protein
MRRHHGHRRTLQAHVYVVHDLRGGVLKAEQHGPGGGNDDVSRTRLESSDVATSDRVGQADGIRAIRTQVGRGAGLRIRENARRDAVLFDVDRDGC